MYVSWFEDTFQDKETNLMYVITNSQEQSLILATLISRPLVVANDEEELDKLWILNYVDESL